MLEKKDTEVFTDKKLREGSTSKWPKVAGNRWNKTSPVLSTTEATIGKQGLFPCCSYFFIMFHIFPNKKIHDFLKIFLVLMENKM